MGKELDRFTKLVKDPIVDVNATDPKDGLNALLKLTRNYGHTNLIRLVRTLLERGVDVNATGPDTFNALHNLCAYYHHPNLPLTILLLKESHIDLKAKTKEGHTAQSIAAFERPTNMSWGNNGVIEILDKVDGEFRKLLEVRSNLLQLTMS